MSVRSALSAFAIVLLAGCATPQRVSIPAPLDAPPQAPSAEFLPSRAQSAQEPSRELQQTPTPRVAMNDTAIAGLNLDDVLPPMHGGPVSVNLQNVPVPVFINEIFGKLLGVNLSMDEKVAKLQELVTVNSERHVTAQEMFRLGRQVLAQYGIAVVVEGDLVRFTLDPEQMSAVPPLVISGRALPQVPISHRPVFQLIELDVVRSSDAARWLNTLFGTRLKVLDETARNAVLIQGSPTEVQQAIDALDVFDRPLMRGRVSTRLEPAFLTAEQMTNKLIEVMNLQGYGANRTVGSPASVIVLPIPAVNSVLVFATSQQTLDYAVSWARELDRPGQRAGENSMFYYQVKNRRAADLAKVLTSSLSVGPAAAETEGAATAQAARGGGSILVDEPRNALIYQGDPAKWERMLRLIQQMDQTPRQVMIEVTVAEVKLGDTTEFGVSWFAKHGFDRFNGNIFSGGNTDPGPGPGLTYLLDVAGQNRLALTAFANDNRVSVLSRPHLLVKSGHEASIQVGDEVPVVTMQTTSDQTTDGNTNLLQAIQYRKTGVLLTIQPTVYSDDRIDLDISQEISAAQPVSSGSPGNSPAIATRALKTSLTLRDGGSVVMAGLISSNSTNGDSGIPLLKDIPVVGNLFKSQNVSHDKTELVVMIVAYIVESDQRATDISQAIVDRLELLELDVPPPQPSPVLNEQP